VSLSPCYHLETSDIKEIQKFCEKNYKKWIGKNQTFAVRATRTGKHPYTSKDLEKSVGDVIDRKVRLNKPGVEVFVEVRDDNSYVYTEKIQAAGGLPLGTAGKVVCLISGGFDSAVAAWLMMKRGCRIVTLYADTVPYTDRRALKRFLEVMKVLQSWAVGYKIPIFTFEHGNNLKYFIKNSPRNLTCILCKRMMYRVANELAKKIGAMVIVTGETLGEVASQTLDNLLVLDQASDLPVFRPLIGNDKEDNMELARKVGTYEKSCMKVRPCEAVPIKPRTKSNLEEITKAENKLDIDKALKESMKNIKQI